MESRHDTENAERILYNMTPQQLVDVCIQAYNQEDLEDENECEVSCRDVGHNIYILAHQVLCCLGTWTKCSDSSADSEFQKLLLSKLG